MPDIKLFVCCHQECRVPQHPLLVPLQVGAARAPRRFAGFAHDDAGCNISIKNPRYCELTGLYWAWKNVQADYYGLFHHRRYLYPDAAARRPYRVERQPTLELLDKLGYEGFADTIAGFDMVVPQGENMHVSVKRHYARAAHHRVEDLELAWDIAAQHNPAMTGALGAYLDGTVCYFGNMCIMSRDVLDDYCPWLFAVLDEFDEADAVGRRTSQEARVCGYVAERLLGAYVTFRRSELKVLELPRVIFHPGREYAKRRVVNAILPPGTRRRATAKARLARAGERGDA